MKLRTMKKEEFSAYSDYFIQDYSREISENYGHSMEKAIQLAQQELLNSFPNGIEASEHELLCMELESSIVGYLWHSINKSNNTTFIYDFFIFLEHRNQGYGKLAIEALEVQLKSVGIEQIKLRVAYHNQRALKLYQKVGFVVTGYNMSKCILANKKG